MRYPTTKTKFMASGEWTKILKLVSSILICFADEVQEKTLFLARGESLSRVKDKLKLRGEIYHKGLSPSRKIRRK